MKDEENIILVKITYSSTNYRGEYAHALDGPGLSSQ